MGLSVNNINSNRPSAKVYPPVAKVSRVTKGATPVEEVDGPFSASASDSLSDSLSMAGANTAGGHPSAAALFEGKGNEVDVYA